MLGSAAYLSQFLKTRQNYNISCPISWYIVQHSADQHYEGQKHISESGSANGLWVSDFQREGELSQSKPSIMAEHALGQSAGNLGRLEGVESFP